MFKRLLVYLILSSMILHCAGRLGLLDSLYQQRHRIAFNLGLIAEIPIAICSGDYEFGSKLNFKTDDQKEANVPISYQASEIILFFVAEDLQPIQKPEITSRFFNTQYTAVAYCSPNQAIFQPPKI
jgi:hypothetical protein